MTNDQFDELMATLESIKNFVSALSSVNMNLATIADQVGDIKTQLDAQAKIINRMNDKMDYLAHDEN